MESVDSHGFWKRSIPLVALVVTTSCAVGPDFTKPDAQVAPNWSAQNDPRISIQAPADDLWWKAFNDPVLDHLVELARQQNLSLQIAGLRIVEARAQLGIATGLYFPQFQAINASADAVGISKNAANTVGVDRNFFNYQLGFDAVWELDFWGKYRRGVEAESAGLMGTEFDYANALVSITGEVARIYVDIRTFEALIALAQENVKVQAQGLEIAQSRFHNGATSELDQSQAATLLESTRATIPKLQISLQQSRNALSTLLGQPTGTVESLLNGPAGIPRPPEKVGMSVPAELLRRRPDIRSAEFAAAAQCARIGVAKAELYPSFSLFGSIGVQASNAGNVSRNLFSTDSFFYSVGPHISWPFFNYGRLKNAVRVQDARFEQTLVNYRDTVLRAAQEVEDSLTGYLHSQEALTSEQASVKSAQRSVELALIQYREGATDYQRVLDAQRSLLQEQNNLTQTSSAVVTNLVALYKALGGGWELRQDQPIVPIKTVAEMKARTDWGDMLGAPPSTATANAPPEKH